MEDAASAPDLYCDLLPNVQRFANNLSPRQIDLHTLRALRTLRSAVEQIPEARPSAAAPSVTLCALLRSPANPRFHQEEVGLRSQCQGPLHNMWSDKPTIVFRACNCFEVLRASCQEQVGDGEQRFCLWCIWSTLVKMFRNARAPANVRRLVVVRRGTEPRFQRGDPGVCRARVLHGWDAEGLLSCDADICSAILHLGCAASVKDEAVSKQQHRIQDSALAGAQAREAVH